MRTLFIWIAVVCIGMQADQLITKGVYTSKLIEMSSKIGSTLLP
jgi:hypothetical protein